MHRRESLLVTAIEIIDELGIQALSIREIAKRQGMSEGTLFRHFKSKSELLLAVLDYFAQFDADITASVTLKKLPPLEAIRFFVRSYAVYYQNYPAITAILLIFDVLRHEPELAGKVHGIFNDRNRFMKELVAAAQRAGALRADIDGESLADAIHGLIRFLCLKWRMEGYRFSLRERIEAGLEMLLSVFITAP